jgi:cobalt-zinc-cadmium efflux system membrane fusion protein
MKPLLRNLLILATVTVLGIVANKVLPASSSKAPTAAAAHGEAHEEQQSATLNDAKLIAAGIEVDTVASAVLKETLSVNGVLQPNQEVVVQVTPRFPGVVRELRKRVGDSVTAGEVLARIESNQSLTSYDVKAPIAGTIIERTAALGEHVSEQKPTFVVADLSTVWADFAVPRRDLKRVKAGDSVIIASQAVLRLASWDQRDPERLGARGRSQRRPAATWPFHHRPCGDGGKSSPNSDKTERSPDRRQ